MNKLTFIIFLIFLISCSKEEYYKREIIGDWIKVQKNYKNQDGIELVEFESPNGSMAFTFHNKNIFEDKRGFYKIVSGKSYDDRKTYFLGNESKYEIIDDQLKLYNLEERKYFTYKILDIKDDTLKLVNQKSNILYFNKKKYNISNEDTFDKIIISFSGCYGTCPVSSILIDKSGEVIFEGRYYTTKIGLYKSKINKVKFNEIIKSFQKADWKNLNDNYEASRTDDERIIVVFIKNNKIIKLTSDYGHESPEEFIWAYRPLRYLYQQIKLDRIDEKISKDISNVELLRKFRNYPVPKPKVN